MKDFIIDFETLDTVPSAKVAIISVVFFDSDCEKDITIGELEKNSITVKFNIKEQSNRTASKSTITWLKNQVKEVQKAYMPSVDDISLKEGLDKISDFLKDNGVDFKKSHAWSRGNSFDFPIFDSIAREAYPDTEYPNVPYRFYNQRDIRTRIEALLLVRDMTRPPMPKGIFSELVAHDCLHDCFMDVIRLKYAECYARGLKEVGEDYEV